MEGHNQKFISHQPGTQKLQTIHQNHQQRVKNRHVKFQAFLWKHHHFMSEMAKHIHMAHIQTIPKKFIFSHVHKNNKIHHKKLHITRRVMQKVSSNLDK